MNNQYLINSRLVLFGLLLSINNIAIATTLTFSSVPVSPILISETTGAFNGTVNYNPGSFDPTSVSAATLSIFLSDDVSAVFTPNIDAPREFASLTSVSDGALAVGALPANVEVDPQLFNSPSPSNNTAAADAGIEDPSVPPTTSPYFDIDVTNLIQNSTSGILAFSLQALSLFPDIFPEISPGVPNPAFPLIVGEALAVDPTFPTPPFFPVFEDFFFNQAQLTVQAQAIPAPPVIWLMVCGILGLLFSKRKLA